MALCYHEEYFALGFLGALFVFAMMVLFEGVLGKFFEEFKKFIGVK